MREDASHLGGGKLVGSALQRGQLPVALQQRAVVCCGLLLRLRQLAFMGSDLADDLSQRAFTVRSNWPKP